MKRTDARDEAIAAQWLMGPTHYVDYVWRERAKQQPQITRASLSWPIVRLQAEASNVTPISKRRKP
jgi:hypothetical protein